MFQSRRELRLKDVEKARETCIITMDQSCISSNRINESINTVAINENIESEDIPVITEKKNKK